MTHTHEAGATVNVGFLSSLWLFLNLVGGFHSTHWEWEVSNPWGPLSVTLSALKTRLSDIHHRSKKIASFSN